jgi:hypothetical protein
MSCSIFIAAKNFSTSQENKIFPEGKRKTHIGIILTPLTNNIPHIKDTNFGKKYRILPKIGKDTKNLLQEYAERRKKYEELSKISENDSVYENCMNSHIASIELKDSENKLCISPETRISRWEK